MECADGQHIYVKYENVVCWWFVNAGTISAWRMVLVTSPHVRMILSAKHSSSRGNCNGIEIWFDHYCGLQSNHPRSIYSSPHFYWGQSSAPCVQVEHGRAEHGSLTGACSSGRLKQFWKSMLFQSQRCVDKNPNTLLHCIVWPTLAFSIECNETPSVPVSGETPMSL